MLEKRRKIKTNTSYITLSELGEGMFNSFSHLN